MNYPTGHIARSGFALQGSSRLVQLWHTCSLSRPVQSRARVTQISQHCTGRRHAEPQLRCSFPHLRHRTARWSCQLTTSCQATASSPHAATVQAAERKQSKKQGGPVALPTTDESAELDRIRHSVCADHQCACLQVSLCTLAELQCRIVYLVAC